jgi:LCP family protein required for cell wall assembly
MRVSPSSRRRSRAPLIWLLAMIACGLISLAATGLAREAARGFDGAPPDARVNVLVLGIDQRAGMTEPARTDTMLLFTLDRQARTAGMLSINRDLWVKIPGGQREGKINTAHFLGELEQVPGGGPALAMQAVQAALDIPVQYYIRLNFSAFEQLIDLIGGVDLDVAETIDDPDYPAQLVTRSHRPGGERMGAALVRVAPARRRSRSGEAAATGNSGRAHGC